MRDALVALDLESTGLDIEHDAIIEVGAVKLKDGRIVEEFSTLVNPGFEIPPDITHLTGIYAEDVANAPRIDTVLPQIVQFVGDAPVIAHNVSFDLGFLHRHGILKDTSGIDTYDLAAILLPQAARYSLSNLTHQLGIALENAHRALDDARATALLYWELWQRALALPYDVLAEIGHNAEQLSWWKTGKVFQAAVEAHPEANKERKPTYAVLQFDPLETEPTPLHASNDLAPVDSGEVSAIIDSDGLLSKRLPHYEHRPQQVQMAQAITEAFNNNRHLMIEAGTGTGKSIAYLLPAIHWATTNNQRVVIATNTINLQDQLINKDIPFLRNVLDIPFEGAVLKGRNNYLCPRRLTLMRKRPVSSLDELRTIAKVLVWLQESKTGDKGEITLRGPGENITWQRLSAEDEDCGMERCRALMKGTCPIYKARKQAEASHVVVVNHALLISDAATENRIIPDYHYLVVDEAHQLEDAITNGATIRIDQQMLLRRINDLGGISSGLLSDLLTSARSHLPDRDVVKLEKHIQLISDATSEMKLFVTKLFKALHAFLRDIGAIVENNFQPSIRILPEHRNRAAFAQAQSQWQVLSQYFEVVGQAMHQLTSGLHRMQQHEIPGFSDLTNSTEAVAVYLEQVDSQLHMFMDEPDSNTIYWLSYHNTTQDITIYTAPLHVGPLMDTYLWHTKESVVLTSATLQTETNFNYMRERLYAEDVDTLDVGSPFDYRESTLIYIPDDIPAPSTHHLYQRAVERGIIELSAALGGRVLVLFTSYAQLRETAQNISSRLALGNIMVYDQSAGSSRETLLEEFKSAEKAVLLGTKSFWQGIDIPGEDLSALVIVRLPFAVPNDPIFAARSETYNNAFKEYAVPDAILRFRQGFGRLIRTRSDHGIVTIFDSRIVTKSYGRSFLESLPDCTIQNGTLDNLPQAAQEWLSRRRLNKE